MHIRIFNLRRTISWESLKKYFYTKWNIGNWEMMLVPNSIAIDLVLAAVSDWKELGSSWKNSFVALGDSWGFCAASAIMYNCTQNNKNEQKTSKNRLGNWVQRFGSFLRNWYLLLVLYGMEWKPIVLEIIHSDRLFRKRVNLPIFVLSANILTLVHSSLMSVMSKFCFQTSWLSVYLPRLTGGNFR